MNDAPFSNRSIYLVFIDENVNWEGSRHNATASDHISILNSILLTLDLIYVIPSWQSLELVFVARHHLQQLLLPGVIYGRFSDRASWASKHWTCQQNNLWTQYNLWKKHVGSIINALCFRNTMDFQRIPGLCQLLRTVRGLGSHQCPWCSAMPYDSSRISRLNTLFITCIFRYIQANMIFNVLISLDFPGRNAALYHVNLEVSLWLFWNPLFMLCLANWCRTEDVWAIQWKGHQGRDAGTGGESQCAKVIFWSWPKRI